MHHKSSALLASLLALAGCGKQGASLGDGSSEVTGSAGPAGARGAARSLVKCDAPVATLAPIENPSGYVGIGAYRKARCPWCGCWRSKVAAFAWSTVGRDLTRRFGNKI